MIDHTHDIALKSWVESANGHPDFPIQNLPLGIFSAGDTPRPGVAIGDLILDLTAAKALFDLVPEGQTLNAFMALGKGPRQALRLRLVEILREGSPHRAVVETCLHKASDCILHLPFHIGDYTDFYVGIHHAQNVGALFRPDNPLLPNYRHLPIGYHGRASSVVASGVDVRRPHGQTKAPDSDTPVFGPSRRLDYELELGVWIGPGNDLGQPVDIYAAADQVAGFCLLNDWSARDIQAWEYQPLGPFLAKNFASTVSSWVITPEALMPFRVAQAAREADDPPPMPYLWSENDQAEGGLNLELEVSLLTAQMRAQGLPPHKLAQSNSRHMYWTVAQMIAHHTVGGCNLRPGDLLGTGTLSGPEAGMHGSLLEASHGGKVPVVLPTGETRTFLQDGDKVILRARGMRDGFASIGFGECRGKVVG
ncbi:fumarylacetoacetase [Asticcacaulis sp. BYS171W]|uniref:fumarylacetoacetase n=1 Tax=Asticcacaulis aquaticus TaxID=2984212 RepID=A0ABT5HU55_9CAUL|nr:fumarylacetoacetase [Asticcacaulis aquaticus]MDC7683605.1 fumarylacetoacetase [Asticcacaulis aquaticus]